MKIFRALGLGIGIIVLKFLAPEIFSALEKTLITLFETVENILVQSQNISVNGASYMLQY